MQYIREVTIRYDKKTKAAIPVRKPDDIAKLSRKLIKENGKEHVILFCLDGNHAVCAYNIVSIGGQTSAPIHPREIFQMALLAGSVSIILAHNHPSGNPEPSREDLSVTAALSDAAKLLGIRFLDHIIVGDQSFYSMSDAGHLKAASRKSLIG